ncbi:PIN domain-containing protein [Deferrisoma palaeochoriense]
MSVDGYVLDTSALFTLIEDEPGADRVEAVLRTGSVWIPSLVLMELVYVSRQEVGPEEAHQRYALAKALPADVVWEIDERILLTAARFKTEHRVSLADAVIAAVAAVRGATLIHKDPEYESLAAEVALEPLPYK